MIGLPLYALVLMRGFAAPPRAEVESARRFVRAFYDWYTPIALKEHDGPSSDIAIKSKGSEFSPRLLHALREDSTAQAKAKGELVGLDFDPILNSQDPGPHYLVGKVKASGGNYRVDIHAISAGKPSAHPDVVAILEKRNKSWRFTNFIYPTGHDLLTILRELKHERAHHH